MINSGSHVIGVGLDIVEIQRIRLAVERWRERFVAKVFLKGESDLCERRAQPWIHYAGRFAAKEAVAKALGTGIGVGACLDWLDIEVFTRNGKGAPAVRFSNKAKRIFDNRGANCVLLSISHARDYAVAQALLMSGALQG